MVERYLDGYELIMTHSWVCLRGEVEVSDEGVDAVEVLRARLGDALGQFAVGRQSVDFAEPPRCVRATLPPLVVCAAWDKSKERGATAAAGHGIASETLDMDVVMAQYRTGMPAVVTRVAQQGRAVQLTVDVSHTLADGRTVEGVWRIVAHVLDARVELPPDTPVPAFGQRAQFDASKLSPDVMSQPWPDWSTLPRSPCVTPPVEAAGKLSNVLDFVRYELEPIRAYCKAHKVGVQALLMAADTEAHRDHFGLAQDTPLIVNAVVDTRPLPWASEAHKKRQLFSGSAVVHVVVSGTGSVAGDIERCHHRVREEVARPEAAVQMTFFGADVDPATGTDKKSFYPQAPDYPCLLVSNVGTYRHVKHPRLGVRLVAPPFASTAIYSYTDDDALEVFVSHPSTMDAALRDAIIAHIDAVLVGCCGSTRI